MGSAPHTRPHSPTRTHTHTHTQSGLASLGELKLIDFGIARAIQSDATENIHRDTQVGTLNFMPPEALEGVKKQSSSSGSSGHNKGNSGGNTGSSSSSNAKPDVRLGRSSDVWSLGYVEREWRLSAY
jgi:serine/threonine-protein kinase TTK/MPS1